MPSRASLIASLPRRQADARAVERTSRAPVHWLRTLAGSPRQISVLDPSAMCPAEADHHIPRSAPPCGPAARRAGPPPHASCECRPAGKRAVWPRRECCRSAVAGLVSPGIASCAPGASVPLPIQRHEAPVESATSHWRGAQVSNSQIQQINQMVPRREAYVALLSVSTRSIM
jgi:hypothetical protein